MLAALLAGGVAWAAVRPIARLRDRAQRMLEAEDASTEGWPHGAGEIGEMSQAFQQLLRQRERQRGETQALLRQLQAVLDNANARAAEQPCCALFIDLDRFKQVNDTGGHAAGDALLRDIARELASRLRKADTVARLGGDEFAVLLPQCPIPQAQAIADKLRIAIETYQLEWEGQAHGVGASIGLVAVNGTHASAAQVLRAADAACYEAKRQGRNRVAIASR
jgi:diguanylate cyclase (GGDEF)-like protein